MRDQGNYQAWAGLTFRCLWREASGTIHVIDRISPDQRACRLAHHLLTCWLEHICRSEGRFSRSRENDLRHCARSAALLHGRAGVSPNLPVSIIIIVKFETLVSIYILRVLGVGQVASKRHGVMLCNEI